MRARSKDIVLDDPAEIADRLLESLHRNRDGHLASSRAEHGEAVESSHNLAVLYLYVRDESEPGEWYFMHEHYVFSHDPRSYKEWLKIVRAEMLALWNNRTAAYLGCYGWATQRLPVTPLRTGDLFIRIDKDGAHGARLTFGPRKNRR